MYNISVIIEEFCLRSLNREADSSSIMNKTARILLIYDRLRNGEGIVKKEIMKELNICDSTYENYMSEIRCHLSNSFNHSESLIYNSIENNYSIIKS